MPDKKLTDVTDNNVGKLTDSEIVKGFKLLVEFKSHEFKFLTDPFDEFKSFKLADVLDLIYRLQKKNKDLQERNVILKGLVDTQKAEIEKLQNIKAYFDFYYGCDIEILGIDENGDTTSFDEFYNCAIANAESIEHHIAHIIKTAKAEAYKEFEERLKEFMHNKFKDLDEYEFEYVTARDIDNLLKEMTGEQDA